MFANSLFKDYLIDNGLKVWKEESTRDIICLEFNYGTRSYEQEIDHLRKVIKNAKWQLKEAIIKNDVHSIKKKKDKLFKIQYLFFHARERKSQYQALSSDELRKKLYNEGIDVKYITRNKNGEIAREESIHYKMLFRSTGKAKKGSCMFIRDRLYKKAINYLRMGIKLADKDPMIVEISAYSPLVASGIVGKIKINPKNILILKDVDRFFETNVVSIETNAQRQCYAKYIEKYKLKNTLFDGEALIDSSIFPSWANGYILLRHHFCKTAAFKTHIQKFFKDYFGDDYYTATVKDMFGNDHYVKDIELITTDNAMKWLKFQVSYECWCQWVYDNDCMFGIVKTAHPSKLGKYQKMSYQMVNSMNPEIMESVCKISVDYINCLKNDDEEFLSYLRTHENFSNDYDVLLALCEHNPDFVNSTYFRERKKTIIRSYVLKMKSGELMQEAENLTIVGSPYAMLLYAATGDEKSVDDDDTFYQEDGTIQCYTERFNTNEYLAFFRSPFNSKNNLLYLHNVYHKKLERYFDLGRQCIAVNMIGTDTQDRANGLDQDSDFGLTTNQVDVVELARLCYLYYPTIVNNIPKESNHYKNTMDAFADVDNKLARSQRDIGESSNLAQIAQTYACSFPEEKKYNDYVCILSVIAQAAIDNAKRTFDIDISSEISRIKKDMSISQNKYPAFWQIIKKDFKKDKINSDLKCPMNYLVDLDLLKFRNNTKTVPMEEFFIKHPLGMHKRKCQKVEEMIERFSLALAAVQQQSEWSQDEIFLLRSDFEDIIKELQTIYISNNYLGLMSWLIDRAFQITPAVKRNNKTVASKLYKNKSILLKILFTSSPKAFLACFHSKTCKKVDHLSEF